tara:strand:- start:272 stop:793 length:522 start_codon:yes stop_codon:yes gene_type:complete
MKLHHTKYKKNYINYILDTIDEDINGNTLINKNDKTSYIFKRFYAEYGWNVEQNGKTKAMTEWLQGLALNIDYTYYDIIQLAIAMGSIDKNASESLKDKVCDNYFNFMANIILSIEPTHIITKDNEPLYYGSYDNCFSKLLDIQPFSTHHAMKYEGYDITTNNILWRSISQSA